MRKVKVNGIECLLFEGDEKAGINPDYPHEYYIRHADNDWDMPATVEKFVAVNKFGFIQAKEPFQLNTYGCDPEYTQYAEITSFIDEDGEELIQQKEIAEECEFCGEIIHEGDKSYGITEGFIDKALEGFVESDNPWVIICPDCHEKITNLLYTIKVVAPLQNMTFAEAVHQLAFEMETLRKHKEAI